VWLKKLGEKQRPKPRKRQKNRGLQRKRRSWSISNDSRIRPPYWRGLKDLRSQNPNIRKSLPEMRRNNSLSKRLKKSNRESTMGVLQ